MGERHPAQHTVDKYFRICVMLQFIFSSVERHSVPYYYINITTEPQKPVTGVKGRFLRVLLAILLLLP